VDRKIFLEKAAAIQFDLCIIGGGATGAGCALEAQSRGLQTLLIEQEDFASGTSSKSTKLIHGGVRYLEQAVKKLSYGQYKMVRKALHERKNLLESAPHVTRPLALLTPCRNWVSSIYYFIGLKLYDWISGSGNIGSSKLLSKNQSLKLIPTLQRQSLYNSVMYFDGQMDDQRLNLAIVQTAAEKGAICLNHLKAVAFTKNSDGKLVELKVEDRLTGHQFIVRAKQFVNACGPFADAVRHMANPGLKPRIRVSKGTHLLLPKAMMPSLTGLLIPETRDGRVIFVLPYGNYLLAGTTDDEVPLTATDFGPGKADVDYILSYVNEYLGIEAKPEHVLAGFGGLRPLVAADENSTKDLVRDHFVEIDDVSGLISILGGKWTTYRLMAKDTINAAAANIGRVQAKDAVKLKLVGSQHFSKNTGAEVMAKSGCEWDIASHLVSKYGDRALIIAELLKDNKLNSSRLAEGLPFTSAELRYVIENEMACTIKDVLNRRWGVEITNWKNTLVLIEPVADFMAAYFGWTDDDKAENISTYQAEVLGLMDAATH
jgi:glycerol-3-phosphate dehydrogenase